MEGALRYGATSVILAHNHRGGIAEPSESDNRLTKAVKEALKTVDITLQGHVIISEEGFLQL